MSPERRRWLCVATGVPALWASAGSLAAPAALKGPAAVWRVLQCLDPGPDQQEHVRDYAAGLQLALQSTRRGGASVRAVQMPCDGSPASLAQVERRLAEDPGLLALAGCTTERASVGCLKHLGNAGVEIAHLAPWLPDARMDHLPDVANVFASREQQFARAVATLKTMGLDRLGVVYESAEARGFLDAGVDAALRAAQVSAPAWSPPPGGSIEDLVQGLPADAPAVLAFAGGAPELSRFMAALGRRSTHRLVISLSAVDLGLIQQLGTGRAQALLMAQVVPNPSNLSVPVVQRFRQAHEQLYDDSPTPSALAGYLAGRFVLRVAERLPPAPTRQQVLDVVRQRQSAVLEGYGVTFSPTSNRGSRYVQVTMLTRDGRLIG